MQYTRMLSVSALSLLAALVTPGHSAAQQTSVLNFSTIDFPDAGSTQIWGINPRGDMVGVYVSADRVTHGFLLSAGQFTTIDYPGAALTLANSINARGDIVGEYATTSTGPRHGFLLSGGRFTTIDFPDATTSAVLGISPGGDIVGICRMQDNVAHGFLLSGSTFTQIDYPGAPTTLVSGIGPRGEILGSYTISGVVHAFLYFRGEYTSWDAPDSAGFTNALAINGAGEIVGRYLDATGVSNGYLRSNGEFTSFVFPGATFTGAAGITPDGDIVGRYTLAGVNHGFLLQRGQQPRYTITDLGTLGGKASIPYGVHDSGWIAGGANLAGGNQHPFLWRDGRMIDLGTLGGLNGAANNANGSKRVSVTSETSKADPDGQDFCGYGTHQICIGAIWEDAKLTALPTLGGNNAIPYFLNERGQIAGTAERALHDSNCTAPQRNRFLPVIFGPKVAEIRELTLPAGDTVGFALGINDKGEAVGGTGTCANTSVSATGLLSSLRAILWKNGVPTDLGNLGGKALTTTAAAINNRSEVIGASGLPNETDIHGFLWTSEAGMKDIGAVGDDTASFPTMINNSGQISGGSCDAVFNCRAFLWEKNSMTDLNDLVASNSPLHLLFAFSINDVGEIVGQAVDKATGDFHAFLATPANAPPAAPAATTKDVLSVSPQLRWSPMQAGTRRLGAR